MASRLYDSRSPPPYLYTRTYSAVSAFGPTADLFGSACQSPPRSGAAACHRHLLAGCAVDLPGKILTICMYLSCVWQFSISYYRFGGQVERVFQSGNRLLGEVASCDIFEDNAAIWPFRLAILFGSPPPPPLGPLGIHTINDLPHWS